MCAVFGWYAALDAKTSEFPTETAYAGVATTGDESAAGAVGFHRLFTETAIRVYQRLVSPSRGSSCPMHPHCSRYGLLAFKRFDPVRAFMMTSDRLHRCGHDLSHYAAVVVDGQLRFEDLLPGLPDTRETGFSPLASGHESAPAGLPEPASGPGPPGESGTPDSLLYHFARMLQVEANLDRAIIEYRRLLAYYPNSAYYAMAAQSIFDCYFLGERWLDAAHWGSELLDRQVMIVDTSRMLFSIGVCYLKLGNNRRAREYLARASAAGGPDVRDRATMLSGLSYVYDLDWREAAARFAGIEDSSPLYENAVSCRDLCTRGQNLKRKSPTLAGMLAVMPGLGYLYDGYRQTALSSFIVNSLFFWATYQAFDRNNSGLGTLLAVLSFGWYSGNIYGSVVSAKRRNIRMQDDLLAAFDVGFVF